MSGGLCKIHGTPLNGFGTLVFCNECEVENATQAVYDSDKESSLEEQHYLDEKDCAIAGIFGYVIFRSQEPCGRSGNIVLPAGKTVYTLEPLHGAQLGAVYQFRLAGVSRYQTSKNSYRVHIETTVMGYQLIYM